MTLPSSGPISLFDIADEFQISRSSPFPNAFYGLGGAPSSGPLAFSDFYGRSRASISASKSNVRCNGFNKGDSATITCVNSTIAGWSLDSGVETSRVTKPTIGQAISTLDATTPSSGNGNYRNIYKIWNTNNDVVYISVALNWGMD